MGGPCNTGSTVCSLQQCTLFLQWLMVIFVWSFLHSSNHVQFKYFGPCIRHWAVVKLILNFCGMLLSFPLFFQTVQQRPLLEAATSKWCCGWRCGNPFTLVLWMAEI